MVLYWGKQWQTVCLKKPVMFNSAYIHRSMLNILFLLDGQYKQKLYDCEDFQSVLSDF